MRKAIKVMTKAEVDAFLKTVNNAVAFRIKAIEEEEEREREMKAALELA